MVGSQGIYPRLDFPLGTRIMHSDPRVVHLSPLPCKRPWLGTFASFYTACFNSGMEGRWLERVGSNIPSTLYSA